MNAKLKRAWVKALRSGKFKQTSRALERIDPISKKVIGNCCLGVLCRIAKVSTKYNGARTLFGPTRDGTLLGDRLLKLFALDEKTALFLAFTNDGNGEKKRGFRGIATWIEKNVPVEGKRKKAA